VSRDIQEFLHKRRWLPMQWTTVNLWRPRMCERKAKEQTSLTQINDTEYADNEREETRAVWDVQMRLWQN